MPVKPRGRGRRRRRSTKPSDRPGRGVEAPSPRPRFSRAHFSSSTTSGCSAQAAPSAARRQSSRRKTGPWTGARSPSSRAANVTHLVEEHLPFEVWPQMIRDPGSRETADDTTRAGDSALSAPPPPGRAPEGPRAAPRGAETGDSRGGRCTGEAGRRSTGDSARQRAASEKPGNDGSPQAGAATRSRVLLSVHDLPEVRGGRMFFRRRAE